MKNKIDVSVIVPVYNAERYLRECLDSILQQDVPSFEVLCVDDGSTDGSADILREYAAKDKRIRIFTQENQGRPAARNHALEKVRGTYICFIDSDDTWATNQALATMVQAMEQDTLDVFYFDTEISYKDEASRQQRPQERGLFAKEREYGRFPRGEDLLAALLPQRDWQCNVWLYCLRRAFIEAHHLRFPALYGCEDELFMFQALLLAGPARHLHQVLHRYRVHGASIMSQPPGMRFFCDGVRSFWGMLEFLRGRTLAPQTMDAVLQHLQRRSRDLYAIADWLTEGANGANERDRSVQLFLALRPGLSALGQDYVFPYHLFAPGARVVIYGAGGVGKAFYRQAATQDYLEIVGWVDRQAGSLAMDGLPVRPLEDLQQMDFDDILLAVESRDVAATIRKDLVARGIEKTRIVWDDSYRKATFYQNFYFPHLRACHEEQQHTKGGTTA